MIEIEIIPALSDNYIYLLHNKVTKRTAVIDPGVSEPVIKKLKEKKWNLNQIINTHHHNDHTGGNQELMEIWKTALIAPFKEQNKISNITHFVSHDDQINIADISSKVIETPGHTSGHVCYYLRDYDLLFSGDTLFRMGCGRVFEGTMEQMKNSLKLLKNLPDKTQVYCGHEYTLSNTKFCISLEPNNIEVYKEFEEVSRLRSNSSKTIPFLLGNEKKLNPFLKFDDNSLKKSIGLEDKNETEVFTYIRNSKDSF